MSDYLLFGPVFSLVFGMLIGSFINCFAWRLHQEETIFGRSYCPKCLSKIKWYDNIPLLSFLILKGKCRSCSQKISWQYPLVELITGLLFYLSFSFFGPSPIFLIQSFIIIFVLVLVFIFDFRWYLIPVSVLLWSALILAILGALSHWFILGYYLFSLVVTVAIAIVFFGAQYLLTKGRGLGEGDIWLGAFLGVAFANVLEISVAILSAYFIGAIVGIGLLVTGNKKWGSKLPLGVFLSIGGLIALFWGQEIASWYLSLFSL